MTLEIFIRSFLACVFLASAWRKREGWWPQQLFAYGLWSEQWSVRLARPVAVVEVGVAIALLTFGSIGLVAAGMTLVAFGAVLASARARGYHGSCGCSRSGRVSWLAATRAFGWGVFAMALGIVGLIADPLGTLGLTALMAITEVLGVIGSIRVGSTLVLRPKNVPAV